MSDEKGAVRRRVGVLLTMTGLLLVFVLKLDIFGHDLPLAYWQSLPWFAAAWLVAAATLVRHFKALLLPAGLLLWLFPFHWGSLTSAGLPNESNLLRMLQHHQVVGASVALLIDDQTIYAGYGKIRKFGPKPNRNTPYPIASVTKVVTGDLLARYLDAESRPDAKELIALATHTSGLPDVPGAPSFPGLFLRHPFDFYGYYDADAVRSDVRALMPSWSGPWEYSNLGFCELGLRLAVAEWGVPGLGYEPPPDLARGYNPAGVKTAPWTHAACHGAGGRLASAETLLEYVIKETGARRIYFDDGEHIMGLGWKFRDGIWYHGGATFGHTSFVGVVPDEDIAVVILVSGVVRNIEDQGLDYLRQLARSD